MLTQDAFPQVEDHNEALAKGQQSIKNIESRDEEKVESQKQMSQQNPKNDNSIIPETLGDLADSTPIDQVDQERLAKLSSNHTPQLPSLVDQQQKARQHQQSMGDLQEERSRNKSEIKTTNKNLHMLTHSNNTSQYASQVELQRRIEKSSSKPRTLIRESDD